MTPPSPALLADVFDVLPIGVIVLDQDGRVVVFNRYEERLAGRTKDKVLGKSFFSEVAPCMNVRELGLAFKEAIGKRPIHSEVEMSFPFPFLERPRDVRVRLADFRASDAAFGLITVEDISAQRAVERMKETLASLLVHDLKNPLAVITASLEFVASGASGEVLDAMRDAQTSAARLSRMILNLLDITRLETNQLPLKRAATDLFALAASCRDDAERMGFGKKTVEVTGAAVELAIDPDLVRRALANLVENALRHARTRVEIHIVDREERASIQVLDDGPGVPEALRAKVFEKYALDPSQAREGMNRGLGLTFVRLVARAHGGEARLVGAPPRSGFELELAPPAAPG